MNAETRSYPRGDIRVSDAERDLAVAELSEHFQSGRLTQDEFDDRSARALQARTGADLGGLFTDLPKDETPVPVPPGADLLTDPFAGYAYQRPPGGLLVGRAILALIIVAIVAGGVFGGHPHHPVNWLIPVVILGFVLLRLTRLARRR
jgi:hypothetical protein